MKYKLLRQVIMLSKMVFYGIIINCFMIQMLWATNVRAQTVKSVKDVQIYLNLKNASLVDLFRNIERQTDFSFSYNVEDLDNQVRVSEKYSRASVADILLDISEVAKLKFKQVNNNIHVSPFNNFAAPEKILEIEIQTRRITGRVIAEEDGSGIPGVNVLEKGTGNGTVTDVQGDFALEVSEGATLVFSSVGYTSEEIPINGRSVIDVTMIPDVQQLEEIVVVGFGRQSQMTTTGAINSIKGEEIERTNAPTIAEAITGRTPGLSTVQTTGQPGDSDPEVFLRGISTLNSAQPLVIIDGVPSTMRAFMQLNPSSIESLSILKDASSTAVYGVRGANGAIIVETRRGVAGKTVIQADFSYGMQVPTELPQYANAYDWARTYNETVLNDGDSNSVISDRIVNHYRDQDLPLIFPDQNWVDQVFANSAMQSRSNINISGGTDKVTYFSSIGYFKQNGLMKFDNTGNFTYDRFNLQNNIDLALTNSTQVNFTSNVRVGIRKRPLANEGMNAFWRRVNVTNPVAGAGIIDGKIITPRAFYTPFITEQHTVVEDIYGQGDHQERENRLNLNIDIIQQLNVISPALEGLKFRTKLGYRSGFNEEIQRNGGGFAPYYAIFNADTRNPDPNLPDSAVVLQKEGDPGNDFWERDYSANRYIYFEAGLDYERTFNGVHGVSALLLYNQNKDYYPGGSYSNIPTGNLGLVGRVRYDYKRKYMAEFNMGYNGSENFAPERRFGWFPSVSAGWVLSEENFIRDMGVFDHLKIRASYGIVGNDQTQGSRFIYIGNLYERRNGRIGENWSSGDDWVYGYNFGNRIPAYSPGVHEASVGNEFVTWETAAKQNYGFEMTVLDNRLSFIANYFYEYRNDILMFREAAPTWLSINLPAVNIGEMENQGYEFQLGWKDQAGDFDYNIEANIAHARNTLLFIDEVPPREPYQTMTGNPLNTNYGFIWEGFYTPADIEAIESGQLPEPRANVKAGDMRYKDLNNDMIIDDADQKPFGYPSEPLLTGGLNIFMGYKGFDLSMGFQGAAQVSRNLGNVFKDPFGLTDEHAVLQTFVDHSWSLDRFQNGQEIRWPRHTFDNDEWNQQTSTFWNLNSSYIRLRRFEFGYTFENITPFMSRARIYLSGNNVFTWSHREFTMMDPEREPGQTTGYPLVKFYNVGFNVTF